VQSGTAVKYMRFRASHPACSTFWLPLHQQR
jgi:hypothetical protein